jgi:hypothetical protein
VLSRAYIPNGKSKGRPPSDFDLAQLRRGTQVEMEHTTDPRIAQRIAMDHLTEDRNYYMKLAKIHLDSAFGDCREETVKFRDRRGRPVSFTKRVGPDCPKRKPPVRTRHLRPYQYKRKSAQLGDAAACSHTSRVVRGGLGALIGGVLGGMIGGGIALAVTTSQFEITAPFEAVKRAKNMGLVATGITILGAVGGLVIGTAKPEC